MKIKKYPQRPETELFRVPLRAAGGALLAQLLAFTGPAYAHEGVPVDYLLPHAHGICLGWQSLLMWTHVVSDSVTAISYYSIPFALLVFIRKRTDLQFRWMFVLFGIFIMACGATHFMSVWTLWDPAYLASGIVKAVTAVSSGITTVVLWMLIPKALALPGPAQWEAVNRDLRTEISERREAEEEVRRLNSELELKVEERTRQLQDAHDELVRKEKLAVIGQLAGSVGHEIRNPLGVMSNAVYYLKTVLTGADETTKEYLDIIKKEIENSQRIITDLLDFARTKTPQLQPVAVRGLVEQSLGACAVPHNIAVSIDVPETLPRIKADPMQMGQVIVNLITNAVQAMPKGGSITVSGAEDASAGAVRIGVADTGEGISRENMRRLFQPLFTTKPRGIGLGLVICKNLVEASGGKIEVESEPGTGTTFTAILPVERRL